jgi:hypothetical protein
VDKQVDYVLRTGYGTLHDREGLGLVTAGVEGLDQVKNLPSGGFAEVF